MCAHYSTIGRQRKFSPSGTALVLAALCLPALLSGCTSDSSAATPAESRSATPEPEGPVETKVVFVDARVPPVFAADGKVAVRTNGERFAADVQAAANKLNQEGFHVTGTVPVIRGRYSSDCNPSVTCAYGFGFSVTDGVLLIARRR